ncbi:hypothetical protein BDN72DRAFT_846046, partial [Pluteus cervinus]
MASRTTLELPEHGYDTSSAERTAYSLDWSLRPPLSGAAHVLASGIMQDGEEQVLCVLFYAVFWIWVSTMLAGYISDALFESLANCLEPDFTSCTRVSKSKIPIPRLNIQSDTPPDTSTSTSGEHLCVLLNSNGARRNDSILATADTSSLLATGDSRLSLATKHSEEVDQADSMRYVLPAGSLGRLLEAVDTAKVPANQDSGEEDGTIDPKTSPWSAGPSLNENGENSEAGDESCGEVYGGANEFSGSELNFLDEAFLEDSEADPNGSVLAGSSIKCSRILAGLTSVVDSPKSKPNLNAQTSQFLPPGKSILKRRSLTPSKLALQKFNAGEYSPGFSLLGIHDAGHHSANREAAAASPPPGLEAGNETETTHINGMNSTKLKVSPQVTTSHSTNLASIGPPSVNSGAYTQVSDPTQDYPPPIVAMPINLFTSPVIEACNFNHFPSSNDPATKRTSASFQGLFTPIVDFETEFASPIIRSNVNPLSVRALQDHVSLSAGPPLGGPTFHGFHGNHSTSMILPTYTSLGLLDRSNDPQSLGYQANISAYASSQEPVQTLDPFIQPIFSTLYAGNSADPVPNFNIGVDAVTVDPIQSASNDSSLSFDQQLERLGLHHLREKIELEEKCFAELLLMMPLKDLFELEVFKLDDKYAWLMKHIPEELVLSTGTGSTDVNGGLVNPMNFAQPRPLDDPGFIPRTSFCEAVDELRASYGDYGSFFPGTPLTTQHEQNYPLATPGTDLLMTLPTKQGSSGSSSSSRSSPPMDSLPVTPLDGPASSILLASAGNESRSTEDPSRVKNFSVPFNQGFSSARDFNSYPTREVDMNGNWLQTTRQGSSSGGYDRGALRYRSGSLQHHPLKETVRSLVRSGSYSG